MHFSNLTIIEHASRSYGPRTRHNANSAGVTAAFAVDFTTAGEKLTKRAAADRHIEIALSDDYLPGARLLYKGLLDRQADSVNVAGNGIYTLSKHGWTQRRANAAVYATLAQVHKFRLITRIVSGGQTGIDLAGAIAGTVLGIQTVVTMPRGCLQRHEDGIDREYSVDAIRHQIEEGIASLFL